HDTSIECYPEYRNSPVSCPFLLVHRRVHDRGSKRGCWI
ncbi:MAG: hypothetical protein AVDCRST_MAG87-414, partial [uncultured Thermomicrobiales bacterium]